MVELNRTHGSTTVMVLRDINMAARYADHLFAMKKGVLVAQESPREVITEGLIEEVFGIRSMVVDDPLYHTPAIVPTGKLLEK